MSLASTIATDHPDAPVDKKPRSKRAPRPKTTPINPATGRKPGKRALGYKKVSFFLPPDLIWRLEVKAVAERLDTSEVVKGLLEEAKGLRRWSLRDLAKPDGEATVEVSADGSDE